MLAVLMVHYGHAPTTAAALAALLPQLPDCARVWVLDNAGNLDPSQLPEAGGRVGLERVGVEGNLGFAAGMNRLIDRALADPTLLRVLLLNNDAVMQPGALAALLRVAGDSGAALVAARLMSMTEPTRIDSLGITLFRSGIASNRTGAGQKLLGPTGGCLLATRTLLDDLLASHGQVFDADFFCYAEDTDLAMRARWLGHDSAYADDAVVLHHGSLASGGPDNDFVLYHGIRNSIWALAKNAPLGWLLRFSPWIVTAHGGIWLANLRKGRWRTLVRLYRDALAGLPAMWRKRRRIRAHRRVPSSAWGSWVEPRLYDPVYLRRSLRALFARRPR